MENITFNLQIESFLTVDDSWENEDSFWCVFNKGYFRSTKTGNCISWEDDYFQIGKVEKNQYNSYDLIEETNKIYRDSDEALKVLSSLNK